MKSERETTNNALFYKSLIDSYIDMRFVKRFWLMREVEKALEQPDCRFVLLTAAPGAGKTAFMAWLAQHNNWLRYFIRRDSQKPLDSGEARAFIFTIGYQMANLYPKLFLSQGLQVAVRQRIKDLCACGKAVGAEIEELVLSPFQQRARITIEQDVQQVSGSLVGLYVKRLVSEARLLGPNDLFELALLTPARLLAAKDQTARLVILVDGLDEVRYQPVQVDILKWLATCPELPTNVRFVLSSRPEPMLEAFRRRQKDWLHEVTIAPQSEQVQRDIRTYTENFVAEPNVRAALVEEKIAATDFISRSITKADGNFQYLATLYRGIEQAIRTDEGKQLRPLLRGEEIPAGLEELYAFFLLLIKDSVNDQQIEVPGILPFEVSRQPAWEGLYQPILGVLSVAREPIPDGQIINFGGIQTEERWLRRALERLGQFLGREGVCYRLYHSTFPEFLTASQTRRHYPDSYLDPAEWHRKIAAYYRGKAASWRAVSPERFDGYGTRHLPTHLEAIGQLDGLHELLSLETAEGKNAWFMAKEAHADVASFIVDVERAWRLVVDGYDLERKAATQINIGRQIRYALITSSIHSLAGNIQPELLKRYVWAGSMTVQQGMAYARQISNHDVRHRVMLDLLPSPDLKNRERKEILREVLAMPTNEPTTTLKAAVALVNLGEYDEAVRAVSGIADEVERVQRLVEIAPELPEERRRAVLHEVLSMLPEACFRTLKHSTLSKVVLQFIKLGYPDSTLDLLRNIQCGVPTEEEDETQHQKREFIEEELAYEPVKLNECRKRWFMEDREYQMRANATDAIMSSLLAGRHFDEARTAIGALVREYARQKWLKMLNEATESPAESGPAVTREFMAAGETARGQGNDASGDSSSKPVDSAVLPVVLDEGLMAVSVIGDEEEVSGFLLHLTLQLRKSQTEATLAQAIERIDYEEEVSGLLLHLALQLRKLQTEANLAQGIERIDYEEDLEETLVELVQALPPNLLSVALKLAKELSSNGVKTKLFAAITNRSTGETKREALKHALESAVSTKVSHEAWGLLKLFGILPELRAWLPSLTDPNRTATLVSLWPHLTLRSVTETFEEMRRLEPGGGATRLLGLLTKYLSTPDKRKLLKEALEAAVEYHDGLPEEPDEEPASSDSRQKASARDVKRTPLGKLFSRFLPSQWKEALSVVRSTYHVSERGSALLELYPYLPTELRKGVIKESLELLEATLDLFYEIKKTAVWYPPVPQDIYVPELSNEFAGESDDAAWEVIWLFKKFLALNASEEVETIIRPNEALHVVLAINYSKLRSKALNLLLPIMPDFVKEDALSEVQRMRGLIAPYKMKDHELPPLLGVLGRHLPTSLHGALLELAHGIEEVKYKAWALMLIAPHLTDMDIKCQTLRKAFELIVTHPDERERKAQAEHLVALLSQLSLPMLAEFWYIALPVLSLRSRKDLLRDLQAFMPVIRALGGADALSETFKAVQDVSRWWPCTTPVA